MKTTTIVTAVLIASVAMLKAAVVIRGPYLQSASHDRITVCWRTDVPTTSEVAYGLEVGNLPQSVNTAGTRTDHAITLTGLNALTHYYYRVKGTPASGAAVDLGGSPYWFRTSPVAGAAVPTRVFAVGDSGYQTNFADFTFLNYTNLTAQAGKSTDLFLLLGDNAYPTGTESAYQGALFNRYASLIRNAPMWSTIGNHDDTSTPTVPATPYHSIFHFPTAGECGGHPSGTERYYSFNHGNIHFICLDTNTGANVSDTPGGTPGMVDWLKDDLMACSSDWIIVFLHQAPYSKGSHDSDVEYELKQPRIHIIPLLENHGVDLVLGGHSHGYERSVLINGHYGNSGTWNAATMRKWAGNGSVWEE
jgi:acid phosphatase type 7